MQEYFAKHGEQLLQNRRCQRHERREATRLSSNRFVGDWLWDTVKGKCQSKTHNAFLAAVRTASRSAGFLTVISESGIIGALQEVITAETASQPPLLLGRGGSCSRAMHSCARCWRSSRYSRMTELVDNSWYWRALWRSSRFFSTILRLPLLERAAVVLAWRPCMLAQSSDPCACADTSVLARSSMVTRARLHTAGRSSIPTLLSGAEACRVDTVADPVLQVMERIQEQRTVKSVDWLTSLCSCSTSSSSPCRTRT